MSRKDPSGLVEGWGDPSSAPDAFPEGDEGLWSAWKYDIPSDPAKVAGCICHYWASSNGTAALAESQADLARGERGPNQLGYDLSLRDTEHYYLAYTNPGLGFAIPLYSVAKGFGFDFPKASEPTWSEVYWGMHGVWDGLFGITPNYPGAGQCR
jgi:hypothetical protein